MNQFKIIHSDNKTDFENSLNEYIPNGWMIWGQLVVNTIPSTEMEREYITFYSILIQKMY